MNNLDFRDVSPHCLNNLINASDSSGLHTTENVYDSSGLKLLTSGYRLDKKIVERLLNRKLQKPLETTLRSENGVTPDEVSKLAISLLASIPILSQLSINIESDCKLLKLVSIDPVAEILLTTNRDNNPESFRHALLVIVISRLLGRELKLQSHELQMLTMSAQVHDLGELYIDPSYFSKEVTLSSRELKNISAHPEIIKALLHYHTQYPKEVCRAVLEHHERADGTGYPRSLTENQLSLNGQILIVAEILSSMIIQPKFSLHKALLAFKLLPNEFPKIVIDALYKIAKKSNIEVPSQQYPINLSRARPIVAKLTDIKESLTNLLNSNSLNINEESIAKTTQTHVMHLDRYLAATGINYYLGDEAWLALEADTALHVEVEVIAMEATRRMRDISHKMLMQLSNYNENPSPELQSVIDEMINSDVQ